MKTISINGGYLIDPANRREGRLNLLVKDGKIERISRKNLEGHINIDASGLIVAPGFVDIHMHEDDYLRDEERFENIIFRSMLAMGVTTAVGGNCGIGPENLEEYIDAIDRLGIPINLGLLLPHGLLRNYIGVKDHHQAVDGDGILRMKNYAEELLEKGLLGLSFGIRYIPGMDRRELLGLASSCSGRKKIIAAHIRDDAGRVFESLEEFLGLGRELDVNLQVSHIGSMAGYGQMEEFLAMVDESRAVGLNVGLDCYPYDAFSTEIGTTTFDEGFLERYGIDYDQVEIAQGKYRGRKCSEKIYYELRENQPNTMAIGHVMDGDDIDRALVHPNVVLASDGILNDGQGHPRAAGSFPRFINRYVKDKKLLSLYQALEKMTILPAKMFGIDKGHLSLGGDADLVIFDLEKIKDRASFQEPLARPDGIRYVLIGGKVALEDGMILREDLGSFVTNE